MNILKSIAPIVGGIVGTMTGVGPGIGSGIATLLAGGDIKDAALAGLAGQGVGSLFGSGMQSAAGAAATEQATKDAIAKGTSGLAGQAVKEAAKKGGIFNTGLGLGDVSLIGTLAGSLLGGDDDDKDSGPLELESRPDYKGRPIKGLFMDHETGIAYDRRAGRGYYQEARASHDDGRWRHCVIEYGWSYRGAWHWNLGQHKGRHIPER